MSGLEKFGAILLALALAAAGYAAYETLSHVGGGGYDPAPAAAAPSK